MNFLQQIPTPLFMVLVLILLVVFWRPLVKLLIILEKTLDYLITIFELLAQFIVVGIYTLALETTMSNPVISKFTDAQLFLYMFIFFLIQNLVMPLFFTEKKRIESIEDSLKCVAPTIVLIIVVEVVSRVYFNISVMLSS